jgi:chromate reductase, NAD(P)H dehydrogenase (quinone)
MKVGVIIGSLRKDSYNRKVFEHLKTIAPHGAVLAEIHIATLPLYNEDNEDPLPDAVVAFKSAIEASDAILFISPEYNRSIPGVLKNAIDWGTRGRGSSFDKKIGAVIGATTGRLGTVSMQAHLKNVLLHIGMRVMAQPEVYIMHASQLFDDTGTLVDERTQKALEEFMRTLWDELN